MQSSVTVQAAPAFTRSAQTPQVESPWVQWPDRHCSLAPHALPLVRVPLTLHAVTFRLSRSSQEAAGSAAAQAAREAAVRPLPAALNASTQESFSRSVHLSSEPKVV